MNRNEILSTLQEVFREVLDDEDIILKIDDTSNDIEDWDSLTHIMIVVDVEKKFNIKFSAKEIMDWKSINDMISCIESK